MLRFALKSLRRRPMSEGRRLKSFSHWGGTTHGQRVVHHGDRDTDAAQEVGEIVVDLSHFQVAIAQFLIERCEFLVGD